MHPNTGGDEDTAAHRGARLIPQGGARAVGLDCARLCWGCAGLCWAVGGSGQGEGGSAAEECRAAVEGVCRSLCPSALLAQEYHPYGQGSREGGGGRAAEACRARVQAAGAICCMGKIGPGTWRDRPAGLAGSAQKKSPPHVHGHVGTRPEHVHRSPLPRPAPPLHKPAQGLLWAPCPGAEFW